MDRRTFLHHSGRALAAAPIYSLAAGLVAGRTPGAEPTTKLFEWERGIAVESRAQKDMAMFFWFYEWNMFEAVRKGEHTSGTFKWPRTVNAEQTEAAIGADEMRVTIKSVDGGADLLLAIANKGDHDWPAIAAIIPCFSPGKIGGNLYESPGSEERFLAPRNPAFANEKTYFLGTKGLQPLKKREIHFNGKLRQRVDAAARDGRFVFSDKWPTAEPDATGGILIRESTDGRWVTGIAWEDFLSAQGHNPWQCMHLSVRVGPLKQNETKKIRGKIYLFQGTKQDCLKRYLTDFNSEATKK